MRQDRIDTQFVQLSIDMLDESYKELARTIFDCLNRAVEISLRFSASGSPKKEKTEYHRLINAELYQAEMGLVSLPDSNPNHEKLSAVRLSMLKSPFDTPEGFEDLRTQFLDGGCTEGVRTTSNPVSTVRFEGVKLEELEQKSLI